MFSRWMSGPLRGAVALRNNILPRPAASKSVYVITTPNTLFGIHRRRPFSDAMEETTSHVLGFQELSHAVAMAAGLEAHHDIHGCFPRRDLSIADMNLSAELARKAPAQLTHVAVEQVELDDLMERLSGTGIVVSLLRPDGPHKLTWNDVHPRASNVSTVQTLNNVWQAGQTQQYYLSMPGLCDIYYRGGDVDLDAAMPGLLPKPVRPADNQPTPAASPVYHTYDSLDFDKAVKAFDAAEAMRAALLNFVLFVEVVCVLMLLRAMA